MLELQQDIRLRTGDDQCVTVSLVQSGKCERLLGGLLDHGCVPGSVIPGGWCGKTK